MKTHKYDIGEQVVQQFSGFNPVLASVMAIVKTPEGYRYLLSSNSSELFDEVGLREAGSFYTNQTKA